MTNYLTIAKKYYAAGFRVIPVGPDKRPLVKWKKYQTTQSEKDIEEIFKRDCFGIAMLTGVDGLEAIDIDVKYDPTGELFKSYLYYADHLGIDIVNDGYCVQQTMSGGYHVLYRSEKIEGNQKLASVRKSEKEVNVLIETRGTGGYILVHPTPGYELVNSTFFDIEQISAEKRKVFIQSGKAFNQLHQPHEVSKLDQRATSKRNEIPTTDSEITPWEDYNQKCDVEGLLKSHGWRAWNESKDRIFFTRPNKKNGNSGDFHKGLRLFKSWSTSTLLEAEKAYSPFALYVTYEHGGDFSAAARTLYHEGYGSRMKSNPKKNKAAKPKKELPKEEVDNIYQAALTTRFDYNAEIKDEDVIFTANIEGRKYDIAGFGQIGVYIGSDKSGKSYGAGCVCSAALAQQEILNFNLDLRGRKMVFWDNEQSEYWYKRTQKRIHQMAGKYKNLNNYEAYHLRPYTPDQRLAIIERYIKENDVGVMWVDGFVDLLNDYNSLLESQSLVNRLMRWTDEKNILLMGVLHVNKGDGKIRGHIGSELKNKCDFILEFKKTELEGTKFYTVGNPTGRFEEFPKFEFTRDERNYPVIDGVENPLFANIQKFEKAQAIASNYATAIQGNSSDEIPF